MTALPPRPVQLLTTALRRYPEISDAVNTFRSDRGKGLPFWPDYCFMPLAAWHAVVSAKYGVQTLNPVQAQDISRIAALGTWRYCQGIYRFDPSVMAALLCSAPPDNVPTIAMRRLPEWCVYIETPGQLWMDQTLHGFWTHLEWDPRTEQPELRLLLDCEASLIGLALHIGPWSIIEAIERYADVATQQAARLGVKIKSEPNAVLLTAANLNPLLSALLYLCAQNREVIDPDDPNAAPARPKPLKKRGVWRLPPPNRHRIWMVGASIGERLRQSDIPADAHGRWEGEWDASRPGDSPEERRFVYRWVSPLESVSDET